MVHKLKHKERVLCSLSLLVVFLELAEHHGHLHLLHKHELHHLLAMFGVLIRAIHPVTSVSKLAHYLRVKIHAFVAVSALGKEFALLGRMVVRALLDSLLAFGEVTAPHRFGVLLWWLVIFGT